MRVVFVDVDGTLFGGETTERRFSRHLLCQRIVGLPQLLYWLTGLILWWPRHRRHVLKKNKAYLTGLSAELLAADASEWVAVALADDWFEPMVERVRLHQRRGDTVVLLTGTLECLASAIAEALGVEHFICSTCDTSDGRFRFGLPLNHPFGDEKRRLAEEFVQKIGVPPADVAAYGDSIDDRSLLEWAGTAVAVQPDPALLRLAEERGWEVLGSRDGTLLAAGAVVRPRRKQ